ncbi:MAG: zinc ABC transporter substrate-binding protein [SAR324 cluster bacterium]|nr:zinc ABC transporter substrate-binding protein [SAR324 cluster bacterium]
MKLRILQILALMLVCFLPLQAVAGRKLKVVTSHYPLTFVANELLEKTRGRAIQLTPMGIEPHDYRPRPSDIKALYRADLIIYHGPSMEPWIEKHKKDLLAKGIAMVSLQELFQKTEATDHDHGYDPHIWLEPVLFHRAIQTIAAKMTEIDPKNGSDYKRRSVFLGQSLGTMGYDYTNVLQRCKSKMIVTEHASFARMAKLYGLKNVALRGTSPHKIPTPKSLARLSRLLKEKGTKYIFYELGTSSKYVKSLGKDLKIEVLPLHNLASLTTVEVKQKKSYFHLMNFNLGQLEKGLSCYK